MSQVRVSGNASGTGVITVTSPNTNSNFTLTLPDATGTILTTATPGVPVNGPAFSAYQSSVQTLSSNTWTKIQLQTEEFDTNNAFDSTTNYRFQPLVAGYYLITGKVQVGASYTGMQIAVYKNGTLNKRLVEMAASSAGGITGSALLYLNGSTDYVELYANIVAGQILVATADSTYFQAFLARSAT